MPFLDKPPPDDFITYEDNYEPDPLNIPVNNDPVIDVGITTYERPVTNYWINNEVCHLMGRENITLKSSDVVRIQMEIS